MTTTIINNEGSNQVMECVVNARCLTAIWLNSGINNQANPTAIIVDTIVIRIDSVKNWNTRYLRAEPNTLRTPTSLARLDERAVDRFMKLTHAISNIIKPISENRHTSWIRHF